MIEVVANQFTGISVLITVIPIVDITRALAGIILVYSRMATVAVGVVAYQAVATVSAVASISVVSWLIGIGAGCAV
jgi:hypothetical protein